MAVVVVVAVVVVLAVVVVDQMSMFNVEWSRLTALIC